MWGGTVHRAALLTLSGAALLLSACGSGSRATSAGLALQREDLIASVRALSQAEGEVAREAQATRAAWPIIANGLPAAPSPAQTASIARAVQQAGSVRLPALFQEAQAVALTGPAAGLYGAFRNFAGLSLRGWQLVQYAIQQRQRGNLAAAAFARANVGLYIESIYDGHFGLSQIGKKLLTGYDKLGGPMAFGSTLTPAEVRRLADVYSEARYRLHPHDGVKFGS